MALPKGKGLMDWVRLTSGKVGISHIENSMQEELNELIRCTFANSI